MPQENRKSFKKYIKLLIVFVLLGVIVYKAWTIYFNPSLYPVNNDVDLVMESIELFSIEEYEYEKLQEKPEFYFLNLSPEVAEDILINTDEYMYLKFTYYINNDSATIDINQVHTSIHFASDEITNMIVGITPIATMYADWDVPANVSRWTRQEVLLHINGQEDKTILELAKSGTIDISFYTGPRPGPFRLGRHRMSFIFELE